MQVAEGSLVILADDGVRGSGLAGVVANSKQLSGGERLELTDGRTTGSPLDRPEPPGVP